MPKAVIDISEDWFIELLTTGVDQGRYEMLDHGMPRNSRILDIRFEHWRDGVIEVLIESPDLPEVPTGEFPPHRELVRRPCTTG